jgi:transcriptional regulator of arginine metabolism
MTDRARRHALIRRLLTAGAPVPSQDALQAALALRGIETTQATLSRDLREMGVLKGPSGYVLPGGSGPSRAPRAGQPEPAADAPSVELAATLAAAMLDARPGMGMVVLTTRDGHASPVALQIDRAALPGVLGTIAGDDCVFIAVDRQPRVPELAALLRAWSGLDPAPRSPRASSHRLTRQRPHVTAAHAGGPSR